MEKVLVTNLKYQSYLLVIDNTRGGGGKKERLQFFRRIERPVVL